MLKKLSRKKDSNKKVNVGNLEKVEKHVKNIEEGVDLKKELVNQQTTSKEVMEASPVEVINNENTLVVEEEVMTKAKVDFEEVENINEKVNDLLGNIEELAIDEKVFELSEVVRKDTITIIEQLIILLEKEPSLLKQNEFVFKRFEKIVLNLKKLVKETDKEKEFDALIMSLNTILSKTKMSFSQARVEENEVPDLSKANLEEVHELIDSGEEVVTYVDNRDLEDDLQASGLTSVISEEQLSQIEKGQSEEEEKVTFDRTIEAKEFLEHSSKIRNALKHKSKHLVSGKFRFLTAQERANVEIEEFRNKFLGHIRRPSIYEMSVNELQRFAAQKGLQNFEGMSRDELLTFVENPLTLYGEKHVSQNPYIIRLKMELADNAALKEDVVLAESKVTESLKAAKAYSSNVKRSSVMWQAFFVVTLIIVVAAIAGILVYFLAF